MTPRLPDTVEHWPLDRLIPYAHNARTHDDGQVTQIAASIVEFGWTNPILVDAEGGIVAGHGRLLAARKLGLDTVPVVVLDHLTPSQRRAYVIADNKLALNAGWNEELLASELHALNGEGFDLGLTGFSDAELDALMAPLGDETETIDGDGEDAADEMPAPPREPVSRLGDLWLIGKHRLLCGDSTEASAVARVMDGERAALVFTSPPYGNQRDYTTGGVGDWDALMRGVFAALPVADSAQVLVNLGLVHRDNEWQPYWQTWLDWMREQGWRRFGLYAWDQGPGLPGDWNGRLAPAFEFVFHFNRKARKPNKIVPCKWAGHVNDTHGGIRHKDGHGRRMDACRPGRSGDADPRQRHSHHAAQGARHRDRTSRRISGRAAGIHDAGLQQRARHHLRAFRGLGDRHHRGRTFRATREGNRARSRICRCRAPPVAQTLS